MATDPYSSSAPRRSVMPILLLVLIALLLGMGAMGWLVHRFDEVADRLHPQVPVVVRQPVIAPRPAIAAPAPTATPIPADQVDERIEALEAKVDQLDRETRTATGEASRAEALLLAFAARRAIDRGQPLGYLEGLLRERFGGVEPQGVATAISASRQPVTIEQLRQQLDIIAPQVQGPAVEEGWWEGVQRELGEMIRIRKADTPSALPVDRFARARDYLAVGRVDAALAEVARVPQQKAVADWVALARRYVQARVALDKIETAALLHQPAPVAPAADPISTTD
ncbi:hypothetical protein [Sphingomonas crocodyli]|uniref:Inner membrane protein n=1 Tax=Sphingomonas crocodyli TaxID=1979270 RepID=A0A437LZD9_9SPHN|nr:hypothetical protein [Sphingomonas crocodyli]RVT90780.1 hypothetical protein EOD43_14620 [Sphingomonas crocodyli]